MSEKKYIDANALISECEEEIVDYDEDLQKHFIIKAVPTEYIEAFPAADVEEVRHGQWIISRTDRGWNRVEFPTHCKCSFCNKEIPYQDREVRCSRCGAKMDKEKEE